MLVKKDRLKAVLSKLAVFTSGGCGAGDKTTPVLFEAKEHSRFRFPASVLLLIEADITAADKKYQFLCGGKILPIDNKSGIIVEIPAEPETAVIR